MNFLLTVGGFIVGFLLSNAFLIMPTVFSWWLRVAKPQKAMSFVQ